MKWGDDFDELPEDYDGSDFEPYDGEEPPGNMVLRGEVKKLWTKTSSNGNPMLVALFQAEGNEGKRAQYDGWSCFDNIPLLPNTAFRYMPFLESFGLTLADLRRKTVVDDGEDNVGTPVLKIGTKKFPAPASITTKREKYEGETRTKVNNWMASSTKKTSRRAAEADEEEYEDDTPF